MNDEEKRRATLEEAAQAVEKAMCGMVQPEEVKDVMRYCVSVIRTLKETGEGAAQWK